MGCLDARMASLKVRPGVRHFAGWHRHLLFDACEDRVREPGWRTGFRPQKRRFAKSQTSESRGLRQPAMRNSWIFLNQPLMNADTQIARAEVTSALAWLPEQAGHSSLWWLLGSPSHRLGLID